MGERTCDVNMLESPGAYATAVRCRREGIVRFAEFCICTEHLAEGCRFERRHGRLYAWRPTSTRG